MSSSEDEGTKLCADARVGVFRKEKMRTLKGFLDDATSGASAVAWGCSLKYIRLAGRKTGLHDPVSPYSICGLHRALTTNDFCVVCAYICMHFLWFQYLLGLKTRSPFASNNFMVCKILKSVRSVMKFLGKDRWWRLGLGSVFLCSIPRGNWKTSRMLAHFHFTGKDVGGSATSITNYFSSVLLAAVCRHGPLHRKHRGRCLIRKMITSGLEYCFIRCLLTLLENEKEKCYKFTHFTSVEVIYAARKCKLGSYFSLGSPFLVVFNLSGVNL